MWGKIVNPKTGRKVNIHGKLGRNIIQNYINQLGGSFDKDNVLQVIPMTYKKKSRRLVKRKQRGGGTIGNIEGKAAGKKAATNSLSHNQASNIKNPFQKAMLYGAECETATKKWLNDKIENTTSLIGTGDAMWDRNNKNHNTPQTQKNRDIFMKAFYKSFKSTCLLECKKIRPLASC